MLAISNLSSLPPQLVLLGGYVRVDEIQWGWDQNGSEQEMYPVGCLPMLSLPLPAVSENLDLPVLEKES